MIDYLYDFIDIDVGSWKERIQEPPYNIKVKEDGNFVLLMYDQLNSDMTLPLCRVCRGIILEKDEQTEQWLAVCYPFEKFFNYGEPLAAKIDWLGSFITEKIDGSLIKFWCDLEGHWHVSTNSSIDAFKAPVSNSIEGLTFGDIVEKALGNTYSSFCKMLEPNYTYMFELVSPETQVTIHYNNTALYYLGERDIFTYSESYYYEESWENFGILEPEIYDLGSLEDCLELVQNFSKDEEGVVVCDMKFNRIKIKSPEYLVAARCANNGKLGLRAALRLIREKKVDDFLAYAPMHREKMELIETLYDDIMETLYDAFCEVKHYYWMPKKNFVNIIKTYNLSHEGFHFVVWHYDNRERNIRDYLELYLLESTVLRMIKERAIKMKEVLDDE